jgi:serine/threonine-protein kinase
MVGKTVSHYRILAKLGEGGMGVVYKAEDAKLRRTVALKFLPQHAIENRERFLREAQAAAALNHPNICTVHEIDEEHAFLAMEFVDGLSVKDKIAARPLPLAEALDIAQQASAGLAAAHEKGIVHRDIKPANLMLTAQGQVKIMDFGLAQLGDRTRITKTGSSLGTPAYMPPEQVRGETTDRRSDLWALGVVLYEMISGRLPFRGDSEVAIARATLDDEPEPLSALRSNLPLAIDGVIEKLLAKDAAYRYQHAGDLIVDLRRIQQVQAGTTRTVGSSGSGPRTTDRWPATPKQPWTAWAVAGVLACALLMTFAWQRWWMQDITLRRIARFTIPFAPDQVIYPTRGAQLAVSPDGTRVAYQTSSSGGSSTQLYLRALDEPDVKPLEGAVGAVPFFSPDGEWLAFYHSQSGSIRKIAVSGGAPVTVGTAPGLAGGTWGEDGNIITALFNLHIVPATGGAAKTLLEPDIKSGERCYRAPHYLPGGKAVLFTIGRENTDTFDDGQIAVLSLDTGKKKILIEGGMSARYSPTGHLVYGRNGSLLAVPFDLKRLEVTGRPTTVVDGVFMSVNAGMAAFSLSAQGDLVFAPGSVEGGERILHWVDRKGVAKPFSVPMRSYVHPRLSTDDARLAVEVEGPRHDIFAYDVSRAVLTRLSIDGNSHMPIWTLRGDRVTFRSERSGQPSAIWWAQSDGGGEVERLTPRGASPESWSPDGRALVYTVLHSDTGADVFMVALDGDHKPRPLVQTKFQEGSAKFSPDGMWVAYCSNESGRPEVYVTQRDGQGSRFQVSTEGGTDPVWRRNGGEMYYRNGDRMMIVSVSTQPNLKLSQPRPLWQGRYLHGVNSSCGPAGPTSSNYDVTADGERFVMIEDKTQDVAARQINVVLGFAEQLKRLAQSAN